MAKLNIGETDAGKKRRNRKKGGADPSSALQEVEPVNRRKEKEKEKQHQQATEVKSHVIEEEKKPAVRKGAEEKRTF